MKIEEGGYYRSRRGDIVGPMKRCAEPEYPWSDGCENFTQNGLYYADGEPSNFDLISRVYDSDEPAEPPTAEPDWHEVRVRLTVAALACAHVGPEDAVMNADLAIKYMKENPL